MDISSIFNEMIPGITYGAGLGIILGLCEWLVSFFVRAVLDRFGTRRL